MTNAQSLAELLAGVEVIDLTQPLSEQTPVLKLPELESLARLRLPMLVVVYDDAAYGAEVHHFGPHGAPLDTVRFPETDLAAVARGFGFEGVTVRCREDLAAVASWLRSRRTLPLLIDAKVAQGAPSWWLEEAFRGH